MQYWKTLFTVLAFLGLASSVAADGVTVNQGVVVNQPGQNTVINANQSFSITQLKAYSSTTNFDNSNFTVEPDGASPTVNIDFYNRTAGLSQYVTNYSADVSSTSSNVNFTFSNLKQNKFYTGYRNGNSIREANVTTSKLFYFNNSQWSNQDFSVQQTEGSEDFTEGISEDIDVYPPSYFNSSQSFTGSQLGFNQGTFDGTSADRKHNSGNLGIGYLNGTKSGQPLSRGLNNNSMIAYWRLDRGISGNGGNVVDYSGSNLGGDTRNGVNTGAEGVLGTNSFEFDGKNDYVYSDDDSIYNTMTDGFTIAGWFYPKDYGGDRNALIRKSGSFVVYPDNGTLDSYIWGVSANRLVAGNVPEGQWTHIAVTYNGDDSRIHYINGQNVASNNPGSGMATSGSPVGIGAKPDGTNYFQNGSIDEVRVYNRSLSQSEVKELYFNGKPFKGNYTGERVDTSIADFDYAVIHPDSTQALHYFPSNKDGSFGSQTQFGGSYAGEDDGGVVVGQFTGNNSWDLINHNENNNEWVLWEDIQGSAPSSPTCTVYSGSYNGKAQGVNAGDIDDDGDLDVVDGNHQIWLENTGDCNWKEHSLPTSTYRDMVAADFNNDGCDDIAYEDTNNNILYRSGNCDGTFESSSTVMNSGTWLASADFDEDGNIDLMINDQSTGEAFLYTGNGDGTFNKETTWNPFGGHANPSAYDFDKDGHQDLLWGEHGDGDVSYWDGYGNGSFNQNPNGKLDSFDGSLGVAAPQTIQDTTGYTTKWTKVEVNASIPDKTETNLTARFKALNNKEELVDSQTLEISDGANNYSLSVQGSKDAEVVFNGTSSNVTKSWEVQSYEIYSQAEEKPEQVSENVDFADNADEDSFVSKTLDTAVSYVQKASDATGITEALSSNTIFSENPSISLFTADNIVESFNALVNPDSTPKLGQDTSSNTSVSTQPSQIIGLTETARDTFAFTDSAKAVSRITTDTISKKILETVYPTQSISSTSQTSKNISYAETEDGSISMVDRVIDTATFYEYATSSDSYVSGSELFTGSQSGFNLGTFDGTSADRNDNSGVLGIGYLNGTRSGQPNDNGFNNESLVGYWRLDRSVSGTGGNVLDYSGNGNNGSTINGPTTGNQGILGTNAFDFDGNNDYIEVPHSDSLNLNGDDGVTMTLWIKGRSKGAYARLIEKGENQAYEILADNGGDLKPWVRINGNDLHRGSLNSLSTDEWHHVVANYEASTGESEIYVDRFLKNTDSKSPGNIQNAGETLRIATEEPLSSGDKFKGKIDEVRVYNRSLSQSEVKELYFNGKPFKGDYTGELVDNSESTDWNKLEVDASIPDAIQTNLSAQFKALDTNGNVQETQIIDIQDGQNSYSLSVQSSEDAEVVFNGTSSNVTRTWEVNSYEVYSASSSGNKGIAITTGQTPTSVFADQLLENIRQSTNTTLNISFYQENQEQSKISTDTDPVVAFSDATGIDAKAFTRTLPTTAFLERPSQTVISTTNQAFNLGWYGTISQTSNIDTGQSQVVGYNESSTETSKVDDRLSSIARFAEEAAEDVIQTTGVDESFQISEGKIQKAVIDTTEKVTVDFLDSISVSSTTKQSASTGQTLEGAASQTVIQTTGLEDAFNAVDGVEEQRGLVGETAVPTYEALETASEQADQNTGINEVFDVFQETDQDTAQSNSVSSSISFISNPVTNPVVNTVVKPTVSFIQEALQTIDLAANVRNNINPDITEVHLVGIGLQNSVDLKLNISVEDQNGNLNEVIVNGEGTKDVTGFNDTVQIDISDELQASYTATALDTNGKLTSGDIGFEITENVPVHDGTGENVSFQTVKMNDSIENTGQVNFNYTITHDLFKGNLVSGGTNNGTVQVGDTNYFSTTVDGDFLQEVKQWHTDPDNYNTVENQTIEETLNITSQVPRVQWSSISTLKTTAPSQFQPCNNCNASNISFTDSYSNTGQWSDTGDGINNEAVQVLSDIFIGERDEWWEEHRYNNLTSEVRFTDVWANVTIDDNKTRFAQPFVRIKNNNTYNNTFVLSETDSCTSTDEDLPTFTLSGDTWKACAQDTDSNSKPEYFRIQIPEFSQENIRYGLGKTPKEQFNYVKGDPCPDRLEGETFKNQSLICFKNEVIEPSEATLPSRDISRDLGEGIAGLIIALMLIIAIYIIFVDRRNLEIGGRQILGNNEDSGDFTYG